MRSLSLASFPPLISILLLFSEILCIAFSALTRNSWKVTWNDVRSLALKKDSQRKWFKKNDHNTRKNVENEVRLIRKAKSEHVVCPKLCSYVTPLSHCRSTINSLNVLAYMKTNNVLLPYLILRKAGISPKVLVYRVRGSRRY